MTIRVDHVVLWVADPLRSVAFYQRILSVDALRVAEFEAGKVMFPSVRLSDDTLIDLMPLRAAPAMNAIPGAAGTAGHRLNHLCLAMSREEVEGVRARLAADGVAIPVTMKSSFGAQGEAPESFYFGDPDGNVLEVRYYAPA